MSDDIRWLQRFNSYKKAYEQLKSAVELANQKELSLLEKQGVIQAFEFTHELAWNLLKDYLEYQGNQNIRGSRDAVREAFKVRLIEDGEIWMETIKVRNITTHTYNEVIVQGLYESILKNYMVLFDKLLLTFQQLKEKENSL